MYLLVHFLDQFLPMMHQSLASSHVVRGQQPSLLHLPTKKHQLKLGFFQDKYKIFAEYWYSFHSKVSNLILNCAI